MLQFVNMVTITIKYLMSIFNFKHSKEQVIYIDDAACPFYRQMQTA